MVRQATLFMFLVSVAVLAGAYAFEYIGGYEPCPLCYQQRVPWFFLIPLSGLAAILAREKKAKPWLDILFALMALGYFISAGLGGYHAGVEYGWWEGPQTCSRGSFESMEELMTMLENMTIVPCDEAPWSLFGISMAGYNALISFGLGVISFLLARRK